MNVRKEEYTAIGDFIRSSFQRDQPAIMARYPKLNAAFLTAFTAKLEQVKTIQSAYVISDALKQLTKSLYKEADELDDELVFLADYFRDAGLDNTVVRDLRKDIWDSNIEGAVLKLEGVRQLVAENSDVLVEEGMPENFETTLAAHKTSLSAKNRQQNDYMNTKRQITENGEAPYAALMDYIIRIGDAGKKVFKGKAAEDEYSITRILKRMRAATPGNGKPEDDKKS